MKILFLNMSGLKFTVMTPETEPLGGSESSLCYLARHLAKTHDVTLVAHLPDNTPERLDRVRHCPAATIKTPDFFAAEKFDAIIAVNTPVAVPFLRQASPSSHIFIWNHVLPDQPSMKELPNPAVLEALDAVIYVSEWQKTETEKFFGINKTSFAIGNGLTPSFENMFASPDELLKAKQNRATFTATPFRGLAQLLNIWDGLKTGTELDIFSSMRVYQAADQDYEILYKQAQTTPHIHHHGSVSQSELAKALKPAAFFVYPCIYPETFCIGALEALASGMHIIATNLGALPTTTLGYANLLAVNPESTEGIQAFRNMVEKRAHEFQATPQEWAERHFDQIQKANRECTWAIRAKAWEQVLLSPS